MTLAARLDGTGARVLSAQVDTPGDGNPTNDTASDSVTAGAVSVLPTATPAFSPAPTATAMATVPPPVDQFEVLGASALVLSCEKRRIVLVDVVAQGRKVRITGAATAAVFGGKRVQVRLDGRQIATAPVRADGTIAATVPAPPRRRFRAARYSLRSGRDVSRNVKVDRRTLVDAIAVSGGKVVIRGRISKPLAKRPAKIVFRRQTSCTDYVTVGSATPSARTGRYTARLPLPAAPARAAVYRGETRVAKRRGGRPTARSFTLARAIDVR